MTKARAAQKVPISDRALLGRINRKLAKTGELVRKRKATDEKESEYYRVNTRDGFLIEKDVDLESLGRKIGTLKIWEELVLG